MLRVIQMKKKSVPMLRKIFSLPEFFSEPFPRLGYKDDMGGEDFPEDFRFKRLKDLLLAKGLTDIYHLDFFDADSQARRL